jgi:CDP-archaeol synthase
MGGVLRAAVIAAAQALYLFAPLLVSAAISGLVLRFDWLRILRRPIDHRVTFRRRRLFGDSKTWRGVAVAVVGSIGAVLAQKVIRTHAPAFLQVVDYGRLDPVWFGGAMGAGAMIGELPNSFVKRQVGIPPGKTARGWQAVVFYLWDQIDLLIGAWPLLLFWFLPSVLLFAMSFIVALAVHPLVALVGYAIGARTSPR